jgi:hypothetical protein
MKGPRILAPAPITTLSPIVGCLFLRSRLVPLSRLADYDPHSVVNKEARTEAGSRVNLDAGQETVDMGDEPTDEQKPPHPEPVSESLKPQGVNPGIAKKDF